jgi:hypothetical protein
LGSDTAPLAWVGESKKPVVIALSSRRFVLKVANRGARNVRQTSHPYQWNRRFPN